MAKMDPKLCRERLLALRARLLGEMTQMADAALNNGGNEPSNMPTHMADLGSDNFEQELTLSLMGGEEDTLDQIEAALARVEEGTYGRCEACDEEIPAVRLEAIPYATFCVNCASQREREEL